MACTCVSKLLHHRLDPRCGRSMADLEAFLADPRLWLWVRLGCSLLALLCARLFEGRQARFCILLGPFPLQLIQCFLCFIAMAGGQPPRVSTRPSHQSLNVAAGRARPRRVGHRAPVPDYFIIRYCSSCLRCCSCLTCSFRGHNFLLSYFLLLSL